MEKKLYFTIALTVAAIVSVGTFAYTYTNATASISTSPVKGDFGNYEEAVSQPDWNSILDDLSTENITCGEVPTGDLYTITPLANYSGDMMTNVYLANTGDLTKAYSYFNAKLYLNGSVESEETPEYRLLTLQNSTATFLLQDLSPVVGTWTQTTRDDFISGTLNQVDASSMPGDVILDPLDENIIDSFDDSSKIASSANVTVGGGQVRLDSTSGSPANEILRPTADGDETTVQYINPVSPPTHWDKVDDVTPDGYSTSVYTEDYSVVWTEDLYQIADHSAGQGQINYVRVYAVAAHETSNPSGNNFRIHIKTNGVEYNGTALTTTTTYTAYSYDWNDNPQTGQPWTWTEIDNLQAGVSLLRAKNNVYTACTQVYVTVNYTPQTYETLGTITSINLLPSEVIIDSFGYTTVAIPTGTSLKAQFSQDSSTWYDSAGNSGQWDTLSEGSQSIDLSGLNWAGNNFYYKMEFTSDGTDTPVLDEITLNAAYFASGDLTSSAFDAGYDLEWEWGTISFTIAEPYLTDVVFQIRTAATEGGLSSATWYGPTSTSDNYTTSGTLINSVHDGDRWIQYKAYLIGDSGHTPTLSDISITYSAQSLSFNIEVIGGGYCLVSDNTSDWDTGWTVTPEFYCEVTQR
ncbi:hypothetical protein ACFLVU_01620 [Chloroflexota bacterium]